MSSAGEWFSASEIAAMALPRLPATKANILLRAKADGWLSRPRARSGGGREFHRSALPGAARRVLLQRDAAALVDAAQAIERAERERLVGIAEELGALLLSIADELRRA